MAVGIETPRRPNMADAELRGCAAIKKRREAGGAENFKAKSSGNIARGRRWPAEPRLGRVAHGVADRVDRLRAIGNGQVPRVVAAAWRELMSWEVPA